ncbi:ROK family transcriptional regulator [Amylibacter sp. IMCC11727]|uniref:ROK family transcriptional regulator n=1 Tax=Amylibacter sp. IMCC11727 TaxID=3039851 RepID=UPI00244E2C90|nr:ROK family transcriptional regulator [Amylibacter sp. IMCC11727]WGI23225.1 ROK family transcriptional regulator [Amylibacter sp. IMCC11727]
MAGQQRTYGRRTLLAAIRKSSPIARIDLAEATGISRATVTTVTAELMRAGLIAEVAQESDNSGRGRPRVDLKIDGTAHLIAGIKVANRALSLVLIDFEGNEQAAVEFPFPEQVFKPIALAQILKGGLTELMAKVDRSVSDLSGVGIGISGIVDVQRGLVHWSPSLSERNVHLRTVVEDTLNVPVFLDNDANLVAMAEKQFGVGRQAKDFIVVTVESGVGMGIVIDHNIYRGTRGCGAEFGHTKVHLDGALCRCGQRGCLEAYVADYALLREAQLLGNGGEAGTPEQTIETLLKRAQDGDPIATNIVNRAGRMFALGLANIVNIFDPQLIILAGERMQFDHLYAEEVLDSIKSSIVQVDQSPPDVVIHKWDALMWAKGAAAYALEGVEEAAVAQLTAQDV